VASSGAATFEYQLTMTGRSPKIEMENGEVKTRTKASIAAKSP
jgi:hypothetical protein